MDCDNDNKFTKFCQTVIGRIYQAYMISIHTKVSSHKAEKSVWYNIMFGYVSTDLFKEDMTILPTSLQHHEPCALFVQILERL